MFAFRDLFSFGRPRRQTLTCLIEEEVDSGSDRDCFQARWCDMMSKNYFSNKILKVLETEWPI